MKHICFWIGEYTLLKHYVWKTYGYSHATEPHLNADETNNYNDLLAAAGIAGSLKPSGNIAIISPKEGELLKNYETRTIWPISNSVSILYRS